MSASSRSKRDLLQKQKRPTPEAKETYYSGERDVPFEQKRPTITHYSCKRDLRQEQKRPTAEAKETYNGRKRDLQRKQKNQKDPVFVSAFKEKKRNKEKKRKGGGKEGEGDLRESWVCFSFSASVFLCACSSWCAKFF